MKKESSSGGNKQTLEKLKSFDLFKDLSGKELKQISNLLIERPYKAGEIVYKINYPHTVLYFVAEGEIKIYLEKDGEELELIRKKKNEHFGEVGLFLEMSRTASARAEEPSLLLAMTKKEFHEFINLYPKTGVKILKAISSFLCRIMVMGNEKLTQSQDQSNES